jgi:hypothetical protein
MKLGFFTMPMHPPGRDYTQTLKEDREAVLLADRLGYCEAFIGEHITDVCETIPSCLTFIASVAHETQRIRLGSGTVNLPNNHPAQVAAHVAMVDHMLEGRFIFGIGPGGLRSDMEACGNLDADVRRIHQPGPRAMGERCAVRPQGPVLEHLHRAHADPRSRAGRDTEAVSEAASADRGDRGGPAFQGIGGGGRARVEAGLSQFSSALLGCHPLADVPARL